MQPSTAVQRALGSDIVMHDSHGNTFNVVENDQYNTYISYVNSAPEDRELLATLNPVDHRGYYVPPCEPGTRQDIFETVNRWLKDSSEPNILWIRGSPGSGKSTIASSLVSEFTKRGQLGASFAFKRENIHLSDPTRVWRTIAYDLARHEPFAKNLLQVLNGPTFNPRTSDIAIDFESLIKEPLVHSFPDAVPVVVIDAIDECRYEGSTAGQRKIFIDSLTGWASLPRRCKLIVTGRDDRIPSTFRTVCKQVILLTGADVTDRENEDIMRFFEIRFAEFDEYLDSEMLQSQRVFERLTTRAAGLFIWANTVVRFIDEGIHEERLEQVLNGGMGSGDNLTKLYQQILQSSFPKLDGYTISAFHHVMGAVILSKIPLHLDDLPYFTSQRKTLVKSILGKLSTVLSTAADGRVRVSHLSFSEFICDRSQCPEPFYIDQQVVNEKLTMACFRLMRQELKFNICGLESSYLRNDEVEDLAQRIKTRVGDSLLYACRFWAAHFQDVDGQRIRSECMDRRTSRLFLY